MNQYNADIQFVIEVDHEVHYLIVYSFVMLIQLILYSSHIAASLKTFSSQTRNVFINSQWSLFFVSIIYGTKMLLVVQYTMTCFQHITHNNPLVPLSNVFQWLETQNIIVLVQMCHSSIQNNI